MNNQGKPPVKYSVYNTYTYVGKYGVAYYVAPGLVTEEPPGLKRAMIFLDLRDAIEFARDIDNINDTEYGVLIAKEVREDERMETQHGAKMGAVEL